MPKQPTPIRRPLPSKALPRSAGVRKDLSKTPASTKRSNDKDRTGA